ncbi:MAG: formate dehydrogenase [Polyangiaceae bacterium]
MLETRTTYCRICEACCGLLADVDGDRLLGLRPDPEHVVSKGFACAKGTRFGALHSSPDRLDAPLVRDGGALVPTSWQRALADAGSRLARIRSEHGPHSVAVYMGNPAAFGYAPPLFTQAFVKALGTRNFFTASSLDCNNKFVVARRMLGSAMTHPVPDLDRARFALLCGTNPAVSQSSFVHAPRFVERLGEIVQRGGRVVIVDPRRTETARLVGEHLPIVPDTDAAFLLALLQVVFAEGLEDARCLGAHALGTQALRRAVARFSPERIAALTGIPPERTRDVARAFAAAGGAFCHVSTGVNQGSFGNLAYAAKIALELATGNLDRAGGALVPRGAFDTAALARRLGIDREPAWTSRIGGFSPVLGALPTGILADEILTPGPEQIRALVVVSGNPLSSAPDSLRMRQALGALELCVCLDLFVNDTAAHGTHVLPCTDFLERDDLPLPFLQLQPEPYLQWTEAVVPPGGDRRPEWRILSDLAEAAGLHLHGSRTLDLITRGLLALGGPRRLLEPLLWPLLGPRPLRALAKHPHGLRVRRERPGDFLARRIATPSGKVELFPEDVFARLDELEAALAVRPRRSLRLFTKRDRLGHNSWMHANPKLPSATHSAHVSPADAERLGLCEGDRLRLSTQTGSIELPAVVDPDVGSGSVAVPHGFGHDPASGWTDATRRGGRNVNELAASGPAALDPLSGMCRFVGLEVQAEVVASGNVERGDAGMTGETQAD